MQSAHIVLMAVVAAVLFGIAHDQVTARICVEYFTIGHPPVFASKSPTVLAFGWGILATWWVGLALGVALAASARFGKLPKRSPQSLYKPISLLLAVTALSAILAAFIGWFVASHGWVVLLEPLASRVPQPQHIPFLSVLWAHSVSYFVGSVGGLFIAISVYLSRRHASQSSEA